jgi:hypothetical protein
MKAGLPGEREAASVSKEPCGARGGPVAVPRGGDSPRGKGRGPPPERVLGDGAPTRKPRRRPPPRRATERRGQTRRSVCGTGAVRRGGVFFRARGRPTQQRDRARKFNRCEGTGPREDEGGGPTRAVPSVPYEWTSTHAPGPDRCTGEGSSTRRRCGRSSCSRWSTPGRPSVAFGDVGLAEGTGQSERCYTERERGHA